jgi:peptidyl-prolyl cis-trans isomerase D
MVVSEVPQMTMLDRMRRHRNWLKWSLGLVCLAFVIFYIPDFLRSNAADAAGSDTVAVVQGEAIRADEFRRTYQAQLQSYRSAYGGNMNEALLKQLGIDQQILQQMVDERAALAEADRLGLKVSDEEVAQRIYSIPAFQENGAFIGTQRYQQLLASQRPPLSTSDFEDNVRRSLAVDKLRESLTEWVSISDKELEQEYRRRNDKVKLAIIAFNADRFRPDVTASDAEVSNYFNAHTADFKIPEKRKVKYLLVDVEALRAKVNVPPADVERAYNENIEQYTTPEQVRASHILLKTDGKDDAAVKARAEDVLRQAKAPGADFAALAKKYSEDESNAKNGGDLDFFGKGRMVPEFDRVAFSMEPGQISDLVKTEYGYHIIKLTDKKAGGTKKLDEVRQQIVDQLAFDRAQTQAATLAENLEKQIKKPADLDTAAKANGLTVQETGLFARDEPILGVGSSPEMTARAFSMNPGEVSGILRTSRGFAFETVTDKKDGYVPKLDEVKDKVKEEVVKQKAKDMAKTQAEALAAKLKTAPDFEKAAKAANADVKTTDLLTRDSPLPEIGSAPDVLEAAFKLPEGAVGDPVTTDAGAAVFKVVEKHESSPQDLTANKETFRDELLNDRKNRFFSAYMQKAKQKMKISVNREALKRVVG